MPCITEEARKFTMNEFLDIYRLYTKNFDRDFIEKAWDAEDIEKLKKLLDKICGELENGHIIISILKNDLDIWQDIDMIYPLTNVRDTVFEIESLLYSKDQEKKLDQLIEENVGERKKEKIEPERTEGGKWEKILDGEEPLKKYRTIGIYPTIKDYIWDRLPTDFRHNDVKVLFKEFYEKKLGRRIMDSSCSTYASSYIRFYKDQDPLILSWDERDYSKDINKYKIVDKEPEKKEEETDIPPKPETAIRKYEKKSERLQLKIWRTDEDDVIRRRHPSTRVEDYFDELPGRTIYAINRRACYLKVKKAKDTKQEKAEDTIEKESTKKESGDSGFLTEETKKLLSEEHVDEKIEETIEKLEKEDKRIEQESVKPKPSNPFYEGSAEHHLYRIAVNANWPSFKKGTPLIMIKRRMSDFSKDEIKKAIDTLVKRRKAKRLPNNFIAFLE